MKAKVMTMVATMVLMVASSMQVQAKEEEHHYEENVRVVSEVYMELDETAKILERGYLSPSDFSIHNRYIYVMYTVQEGDTLSEIAEYFGISMQKIMQNNPQIEDANVIWAENDIVLMQSIDGAYCIQ